MGEESVDDAAAAFLADMGASSGPTANKKKKKKAKAKPEPSTDSKEPIVTENQSAEDIMKNLGIEEKTVAKTKKKKPKKKKNEPKEKPKVSAMGALAAQHLKKKQEELKMQQELEENAKRLEEEEKKREKERIEEEKNEKLRQIEERKRLKEEMRKAGKAVTKAEKAREEKAKKMREQLIAQGRIKVDENGNIINQSSSSTKSKSDASLKEEKKKEKVESPKKIEIKEIASEQEKEIGNEKDEEVEENWEEDDWEAAIDKEINAGVDEKAEEGEVVIEEFKVQKSVPKKQVQKKISEDESLKPKQNVKEMRSPICCVMGHVDTGKTKILDKIRKTNVQDNEAGGITQQIGATFFPMENLRKLTDKLNNDLSFEYKVPGLLMIDTPGHESFSNLRKRGSNLCDIAILIVDLMHGLEQQTKESLKLLRDKKTPFIVALNKVDRLYDWQPTKDSPFRESLSKQSDSVILEFDNRSKEIMTQLMEEGLNSKLYYENDDFRRTVSLVPTSAHTGEGIPDLLLLLIQLTQKMLKEKLTLKPKLECNVIEVKKIEGVGTTVDVVLVNGHLSEGDEIIAATLNGAVRTQIKALLTPQPLREMRVKSNYIHHKMIRAAMGVKIVAPGLEEAIAGTQIVRFDPKRDKNRLQKLEDEVMADYDTIVKNIDQSGHGVCVQASTLGSLEALIDFLKGEKIPINCVNLGPIYKKDVMRASVMLEHRKEFATILAFDVKVTKDAQDLSEELGVKIFTADIIYHLFDQFTKYMDEVKETRKESLADVAVFPCILKIIPENVFMKKSPLVFGVEVLEGIVKVGTPIVVPDKIVPDPTDPNKTMMLSLGKVESIEKDHKEVETSKKGSKVCIKITGNQSESYVQFGRHFDDKNQLYSKLSRKSIDSLKENFKDDLAKSDWLTVIKLKKLFNIQ